MLKILVVEDNIIQCKQLVNFISKSILELKLYSMTFTGDEALEIIKNEDVDIIILDLVLPDISGIKILEYIQKNKLYNYRNSIIIISGEAYKHPELVKNQYINNCFQKPINFDVLIKNLENLIYEKKNNIIKEKINVELSYLKFNMSYKGTKYLAECIYLLYNRELSKVNLSKEIYPILGKKYNTNSINIKCNIFQACNNSYFECEQDILEKYFNLPICAKPKTMELIIEIIRHIK